jgi:hypothetical protein
LLHAGGCLTQYWAAWGLGAWPALNRMQALRLPWLATLPTGGSPEFCEVNDRLLHIVPLPRPQGTHAWHRAVSMACPSWSIPAISLPDADLTATSSGFLMTPLRNSRDLLSFVEELIKYLQSEREPDLANRLVQTNRYIAVSSAEYYNEVELALKAVLSHRRRVLSAEREDEILQTIRQIDETFRSRG